MACLSELFAQKDGGPGLYLGQGASGKAVIARRSSKYPTQRLGPGALPDQLVAAKEIGPEVGSSSDGS